MVIFLTFKKIMYEYILFWLAQGDQFTIILHGKLFPHFIKLNKFFIYLYL